MQQTGVGGVAEVGFGKQESIGRGGVSEGGVESESFQRQSDYGDREVVDVFVEVGVGAHRVTVVGAFGFSCFFALH